MEIRELPQGVYRADRERLLSRAFPVPAGASFYDDFPVWDPRHGLDTLVLGAYDGERIAGTAGARFASLRSASAPAGIPVALVGAVATDESYRGRGLASSMTAELVRRIDARGARFSFLFGSEHTLYGRHGFALGGSQLRAELGAIEPALAERAAGAGAGALGRGFKPSLLGLLGRRSGGLAIGPGDADWIRAHRNVDWRWIGPAEAPLAYAAIGKGIDLGGMVHEWGGEPEALRALLLALARENPALQLLGHESAFRAAGIPDAEAAREPLCLVRPGPAAGALPEDFWLWGLDSA